MAVNQGGSQAVVLQLELFCASSSVSFSPLLFFPVCSLADTLPIEGMLKQSLLQNLNELEEGGHTTTAAAAAAAGHARTHAPDGTGRRIK